MCELKPCPFCGAEQPKPHIWYSNGGAHECQSCKASGPTVSDVGMTMADNKPRVIATWNHRAPDRATLVAVCLRLCEEINTDMLLDNNDMRRAAEDVVTRYLADQERGATPGAG